MMRRLSAGFLFVLLLAASLLAQNLVVTFLDCGQGDAIVVQTPNKKTYLIDTGPNDEEFGGDFDAGKMAVLPFLNSRHVGAVDGILISHPHLDHYGGTFAVLKEMKVLELIDSGIPSLAHLYRKLLVQAELLKTTRRTVKAGDKLDWGPELEVRVLWPPGEILNGRKKRSKNVNNDSIVLKITHGENSFLFSGDAEKSAEQDLADDWGHELQSKVLKAPHHGSKTSSTDEFLDAVNPMVAVISCGRRNKFKHPSPIALKRLEERKIGIYRTDEDGTVEVTSDGAEISVKTFTSPSGAKAP